MYRAIRQNKINTVLILLSFVLIIGGIGALFGWYYSNWTITIGVVAGTLVYATVQYFLASRQAIAMAGGTEITESDNPRLYRTVENLAISQGMPMPKVYIVSDPAPNAFATGRSPANAMVAATTGLLDLLNDAELEGVMAHELGHVKNYDIRVNMVVFGLVVAIAMLSDVLVRMAFLGGGRNNRGNPIALVLGLAGALAAPLAATMVQLAVSRQREYLADATGVMMTRYPEGLASALHKLEQGARPLQKPRDAMAHMWIADPLPAVSVKRLFQTHPPIPSRIRRLLDHSDSF